MTISRTLSPSAMRGLFAITAFESSSSGHLVIFSYVVPSKKVVGLVDTGIVFVCVVAPGRRRRAKFFKLMQMTCGLVDLFDDDAILLPFC